MHYKICFCAILLALNSSLHANPLNPEQVPPDAKWLLHVDLENLRKTQVGDFLLKGVVAQQIAQFTNQLKFDLSNLIQKISSVTAYGMDFKKGAKADGVLLINADTETQKVIEGLLAALILADADGPIKKLELDSGALYSIHHEIFASLEKGGLVILSRSQEKIEMAREMIGGKTAKVNSSKLLTGYPGGSNSFFFLGVADGFVEPGLIPPQAKILQMAEGGRILLGETADQLFLSLALRGKTSEVTKQIQQVIEGMLALVSLGQPDNQDLLQLAKSTKVSSTAEVVNLSVEYPVAKVLALLAEQTAPKKPHAKHAHSKPKPEADPAAAKENQ